MLERGCARPTCPPRHTEHRLPPVDRVRVQPERRGPCGGAGAAMPPRDPMCVQRSRRADRRQRGLALLLALLTALLAACADAKPTPTPSASTSAPGTPIAAAQTAAAR